MPADEVHHEGFAGEPRARTGPRHAAPRKPLLTRLQVPAGKAIAIAAMPTAVLMGMGLTPTLAQAKPGVPDNPFQDGPCVTAPDKDAEHDAEKDAADKAKEKAAEKAAKDAKDAEKAKGSSDKDETKEAAGDGPKGGTEKGDAKERTPSAPPSSGAKADPDDKAGTTAPSTGERDGKESEKSGTSAEPTETRNPWDPLGVGDALKDVFTPDKDKDKAEDEADAGDKSGAEDEDKSGGEGAKTSGSPQPDPSTSKESGSSKSSGSSEDAEDPVKDAKDKLTEPVEDTVDKLKDKTGKAADKAAGDAAKDKAEGKTGDEADDPPAPDVNGKKPFPCVVEKKVDGKAEQPPAPIPNQPWNLEASSLTLKGADYQGVVNLTMPNGRSKQALKYVVQNTDIGDLHQIVEGPAGKKYHVEAAKGSTSTIRGGETTMYTESISGKLFGLIPITFDPEHPPPLNIPLIYFTDVKVQQAGQFGGNLTIPGLHQSITD
ncbi:hypothetical protein ACFVYR_07555 [Streptomyces sp. NPDC058284]|uniref:hypothetical protein n=1 Tax=unclassified Streptomyces TaxID=2593676 RepID=UPI003650C4EE